MSYNGGLEDPQSWPFSVRYTASPYRKSKFPVDATVKSSTSDISPPSHYPISSTQYPLTSSLVDTTVTSGFISTSSSYISTSVQNHPINSVGLINRNSHPNNSTSSSTSSSLPFPLQVPHHQANQPLFAQALANYHNSQQSQQTTNFRQNLHHNHNHNGSSGNYHQRQMQFQKGSSAASSGRPLTLENPTSHLHQLHQYQNHERQQRLLLQQRLLMNSSNVGGNVGASSNIHPFLNSNLGGGGGNGGLPDHHHYGLPIQSSSNTNGTASLLEAQLLQQRNSASASVNQPFKQGNPVWHLLTENKDLDQVEGLDEGYIEDLKQPFIFHHHPPPTHTSQSQQLQSHLHQQINSIKNPHPPNFSQQNQQTNPSNFTSTNHYHHPQYQPTSSSSSDFPNHIRPLTGSRHPMVFGTQLPIQPNSSSSSNEQSNNPDYDPYSYVYDGHILSQDDIIFNRNGGYNPHIHQSHHQHRSPYLGFNGTEFPNKVILAQSLSNTSSLQGIPPSLRTAVTGTSGTNNSSDEDVSENEYEEIQDVARYMNSATFVDTEPGTNETNTNLISNTNKNVDSVNSSSSPDDNYEYDSVHPNYDDVGGSGPTTNPNSESKKVVELDPSDPTDIDSRSTSPGPPVGPPRHFKSFSSTDDILAEVVQVRQKHDRVLDQLNLEVENLLIRSTKQEIEENELNCQRTHNTMMMLAAARKNSQDLGLNPTTFLGSKYYSAAGGEGGTCQQTNNHEQMPNGKSEIGMLSDGLVESRCDGGGVSNNGSSCNCCCCSGCCGDGENGEMNNANGNPSAVALASNSASCIAAGVKDKNKWRETLKASLLSGFHNHPQNHYHHHRSHSSSGCGASSIISSEIAGSSKINSGSVACISGLGSSGNGGTGISNGTFSRKKKLDRNAPGQLSDTNLKHKLNTLSAIQSHNELQKGLKDQMHFKSYSGGGSSGSCTALCVEDCANSKKNMGLLHQATLNQHSLVGGGGGGKGWKGRYQRSNSLIPNWKIRDHLMRLPFLRQNKDKLKKGDGLATGSSLNTATSTTTGVGGGGTSISGVDFPQQPPPLLGAYNKNQCNNQNHHQNHPHLHNHHHHHHYINNGNNSVAAGATRVSTCINSHNQSGGGGGSTNNKNIMMMTTNGTSVSTNPADGIKLVRSSSMDELRPTEEHWYSADSDTEPDSLTAIIPQPPQSQPPSQQNPEEFSNNIQGNDCCGTGNGDSANVRSSEDVCVTVIDPEHQKSCCCGNSPTGDSGNCSSGSSSSCSANCGGVVGNIYTNSPNGGGISTTQSAQQTINGGGSGGLVGGFGITENGTLRMDVVSSTGNFIPDAPKAPKFRRGTQGLKDKWRESWSHSKTLSKNNMEEENRLLRWFSLRKNSTTLVDSSNHTNNHRHSTLPQLTEEDLKRISFMEDEEGYWPRRTVQPPSLPPPPSDLSSDQITRRHIIAAIVHSENSYVAALQRLVNEYKKPLECSHPAMLSHSKISSIFHRVPEILQCHSLFRIALAECIRRWDTDEKIGDVFVASFSKSLVLDVYSEFINNFGTAMETAKIEARRKSAFAEFLKVKQMTAHDRLSLFGLMVKPVQRFPQFILLLQDLLKHTPRDHHDRMSLQLALTQLESLAAMLNERKRESEQYQAFKETIKSIGGGKFVLLRNSMDDSNRILLRQDVVTQLEFDSNGGTVAKSKCRKLLLLNDMLICTTLPNTSSSSLDHNMLNRQNSSGKIEENSTTHANSNTNTHQSSGKQEKCMFKWSYPVREVEVEDMSISPTMSRFVQNMSGGSKGKLPSGAEDTTSITLLEEMQSLMHDYEVLSRVLGLVQVLKSSYEGLTEQSVKELMLDIQHQIQRRDEQISYFDSSCLTVLLGQPGNTKEKVTFQMQSPQQRNEWIEELRLAQLALDPSNSPAWDIPQESPYPLHKLPLFVRASPVCRSPHLTTVKCGCYFTHTFVSQTGRSKILDYLWVSSTDGMSSHITAFRSQQNTLKEVSSFDLVEEKVNDLLFVLGHIWMGTESRKIMVYDPSDPDKGNIGNCLLSDSITKLTFYNNTIYAGLADGNIAVFTELTNPKKYLQPEVVVKLGPERITSIFGSKDNIYAACGKSVVTIDAKTHTIERNVVLTHPTGPISHMACSGVGLWIATHETGTVCLYHLESLQHLQDVSIAPSVFRTVRDSFRRSKGVHVTCLMAHKGWLWIGTNLGVVLTIPLPRLEGVPIISTGNANVSFHGFIGPVSFLMPLMKPSLNPLPISQQSSAPKQKQNQLSSKPARLPQVEFKENNIPTTSSQTSDKDESSYMEMTAPKPVPVTTTATPVVLQSDDLQNGELCLNSSSNNVNSVSFSNHQDNSKDETDTQNEDENKHDSLSSVPSADLSTSSSFNQISNGDCGAGSDRSSCNSMERGVTPVSSQSSPSTSITNSKTLVVLRKKSSKDNVFLRNCKTLPRGGAGPIPSRFSIESDVYGLYGNLINVRGLEDEGRFVDPLYDALRRSDPELNALDAKISTLDRRLKMRMSRPRSLDLSNWSVDSKISASSDESVGMGSRSSQQTTDSNGNANGNGQMKIKTSSTSNLPGTQVNGEVVQDGASQSSTNKTSGGGGGSNANGGTSGGGSSNTNSKKTMSRQKHKSSKGGGGPQERTVLVVVGGRGYLNMRTQPHPDNFLGGGMESESKSCTHLTLWQMKT